MPLYDFECSFCEDKTERLLTISQKEHDPQLCEVCGHVLNPIITKMTIVSGVNNTKKLDEGFKDVLREVKKTSGSESTIDPDGGLMSPRPGTTKTEDSFGGI